MSEPEKDERFGVDGKTFSLIATRVRKELLRDTINALVPDLMPQDPADDPLYKIYTKASERMMKEQEFIMPIGLSPAQFRLDRLVISHQGWNGASRNVTPRAMFAIIAKALWQTMEEDGFAKKKKATDTD